MIETEFILVLINSQIPELLSTLYFENQDQKTLRKHLEVVEDQEYMREKLSSLGMNEFEVNTYVSL